MQLRQLLISFLLLALSLKPTQAQVCSGVINTVWQENFGAGASQIAPSPNPNINSNYNYGNYGVNSGNYTIVNRYDYYNSWHLIPQDHTPNDSNGYFLVIDGLSSAPIFYDVWVDSLCPFTQYAFSTYAMNIDLPAFPSNQTFTFLISDTAGNQLATWTSPPVAVSDTPIWHWMGFNFSSGNNTKLRLQVRFNETGYDDFAFDDFQFSICGPTLSISTPVTGTTCVDSIPLVAQLGSGYAAPVYQWQKKNAAGIWQSIAGANAPGFTDYQLSSTNVYRVIVGDGALSCPILAEKEITGPHKIIDSLSKVICHGENFEGYSSTGIYNDTFQLSNGCDSIRILRLTVNTCTQTIPCASWLRLPNSASYATVGDLDIPGHQITVEGLFSRDSAFTELGFASLNVVSKHQSPADVNYLLRVDRAQITTSNGHFGTPDICATGNKRMYHAAMTYDGTELKFYRNGFLMSSVPCTGDLVLNDFPTTIGATAGTPTSNTSLPGYLQEIRIWNTVRSQAELQNSMSGSLSNPTAQSGLLAYYRFDDLTNKQGTASWDVVLHGQAQINQTIPDCSFAIDSCILSCPPFDFSFESDACDPKIIQFTSTDLVTGNQGWDFGDGFTGAGTPATHTFSDTGSYAIRHFLRSGCTDTLKKIIHIQIVSDSLISIADSTICSGDSIQLRSTPALSYCWTPATFLNDPNAAEPVAHPQYPITYYLRSRKTTGELIANGSFTNGNTGFSSDYISSNPNSNEGQYFIGTNPNSWNGGLNACGDHTSGNGNLMMVNGSPQSGSTVWQQTIQVVPQTDYAFSAWITSLTAVNPAKVRFSINGSIIGAVVTPNPPNCEWQQFYSIWNSGSQTTATISIVNENTILSGNDFGLDDLSFSAVYIAEDSIRIGIDTPLIQTIADTSTCRGIQFPLTTLGNAVQFQWTPATGLNVSNPAAPIASPADTTMYWVTGTTAKGCKARDSVQINILPSPRIQITPDTLVCRSSRFRLSVTGANAYVWSPATNLDTTNSATPLVLQATAQTFYVISMDSVHACSSLDSVRISLRTPALFSIRADQDTVCAKSPVQLLASGGTQYAWTPARYLNDPTIANPIGTPDATMVFVVKIKDSVCNDSALLNYKVNTKALPLLQIRKSNDIDCYDLKAKLQVTGAHRYLWTSDITPLYMTDSTSANPTVFPSITRTYYVTGSDTLTGCSTTDSIMVYTLIKGNPDFWTPRAFSPNHDGLNDCWRAIPQGRLLYYELAIYNRWGNRVFYTNDVTKCWDGTYMGQPQDPGNFTYYLKARNECISNTYKGNLLLLR